MYLCNPLVMISAGGSSPQTALEIREQQLGPQHPDTARSLDNLATLYNTQERYAEAEPLYQRALEIYKRVLGRNHLHTQTIRRNYAVLLRTMGRDGEARMLEAES